jgi:hypothetical protein
VHVDPVHWNEGQLPVGGGGIIGHSTEHVASQVLRASGMHEPSLSHVPVHENVAQSGQHSGSLVPASVQQREPAPHSVELPALAQAALARVMHSP